jgi:hypothetical protein
VQKGHGLLSEVRIRGILNAEGAKVSQRAQKKIQKKDKMKYSNFCEKSVFIFGIPSALFAKPLRPLRSKIGFMSMT